MNNTTYGGGGHVKPGMSTETQILISNLNADKIALQAEIAELKRENARLKDRAPW